MYECLLVLQQSLHGNIPYCLEVDSEHCCSMSYKHVMIPALAQRTHDNNLCCGWLGPTNLYTLQDS